MAQFKKKVKYHQAIANRLTALNKQIDAGGGQAVAARRRKAELVHVGYETMPRLAGEGFRAEGWNGARGKQTMKRSAK